MRALFLVSLQEAASHTMDYGLAELAIRYMYLFLLILLPAQSIFLPKGVQFRENFFWENKPVLPVYDFVIVGSGPAGSALANKLSQVSDWTILLIEKGPEGNILNDIPLVNPYTVLGHCSKVLPIEEDPDVCTGLHQGRCHWPSSHCLGGASQLNSMIFTRGIPADYDAWADKGNRGWSFKDVYPYFLELENMTISPLMLSRYHASDGPMNVEYPFQSEIGKRFLMAGNELGYDTIDYNNPRIHIGFSEAQVTAKSGKRHSAVSTYLLPAKNRKNLHIIKGTLVTKVLIDPETKNTIGVRFMKSNEEREVFIRKEVILSGGGFGSPQLLMLSGIGIWKHLVDLDIPVIKNLPVGNNLQEHLSTPALQYLINTTDSFTVPKIALKIASLFLQWFSGNGGILSNNGPEGVAFVKTPFANEKADLELMIVPIQLAGDGGVLRKAFFLSDDMYQETWKPITYKEGFQIVPMPIYPRSRGTVRLRSTDPNDPPVIRANFYSEPHDVRVMRAGIRIAQKIAATRAFREIGARLHDIPVPGCPFRFDSDRYWDCVIRRIPNQIRHQSGTCKMGPDPKTAVVDSRLRVHGVDRLRVADASIMPFMVGPHLVAPCYMIGAKAADLIKEDWNSN